jgi:flagellum-specific ATP synthase
LRSQHFLDAVEASNPITRSGKITRVMPTWLEADGPNVPIGTLCLLGLGNESVTAEVIKVEIDHIALIPFGDVTGLCVGARVVATTENARVPVGDVFLGRAIDALAVPIDNKGVIKTTQYSRLHPVLPEPLDRITPAKRLDTGLRAIDGLLTLGVGQRFGVFAASGVGKTSLMSQIARQVESDIIVICLVGERGREVEHLWSTELPEETRKRTALIAATSDKAAALRVRAVYQALALANYWRAKGQHVLFILDSVTRLAMAMREAGLAAGEPPTVRAYTPSVFSAIPRIVEQCGALKSGGAITALMTVLSETDEIDDPISEMLKSLLDGHIILSRSLAERGHFPAIDVSRSISRNASRLMEKSHFEDARTIHTNIANYESSRTLIESGLYAAGASETLDLAISTKPDIDRFLTQGQEELCNFSEIRSHMQNIGRMLS